MKKKELELLEKAFASEIDDAMNNQLHLFQTKSKLADQLASDGYLEKVTIQIPGGSMPVTIKGFVLTHKGRIAYCQSCTSIDD